MCSIYFLPRSSIYAKIKALLTNRTGLTKMFKILMIDDEISYHELYKDIITEEFTADIDFATNGLEALEILNSSANYDLLILDLDMPKLDGFETLKQIRLKSQFKSTPIFILTANSSDENQKLLLNLGANDFIAKGCPPEIFLARLKNLIVYKNNATKFITDNSLYEYITSSMLNKAQDKLTGVCDLSLSGTLDLIATSRELNKFEKHIATILDMAALSVNEIKLKQKTNSEIAEELTCWAEDGFFKEGSIKVINLYPHRVTQINSSMFFLSLSYLIESTGFEKLEVELKENCIDIYALDSINVKDEILFNKIVSLAGFIFESKPEALIFSPKKGGSNV